MVGNGLSKRSTKSPLANFLQSLGGCCRGLLACCGSRSARSCKTIPRRRETLCICEAQNDECGKANPPMQRAVRVVARR